MSKSPFVITLVLCGTLLAWLYSSQNGEGRELTRPAGVRPNLPVYGYPDPRGIQLELRETPTAACEGARFRSESPDLVLWDDGTVVFRDSTYDYKRGRVSARTAQGWMRTFLAYSLQDEQVLCDHAAREAVQGEVQLRGRGAKGSTSVTLQGFSPTWASHADSCADCRPVRPLLWLVDDLRRQKYQSDADVLTGLPMEVHLEFRSCGCRRHPEIVAVSKEWPLDGPKPAERCGRGQVRFRLDDPVQIRALGEAIERSASVLDREEIYTCFMRPLLDPRPLGPLAVAKK